MMTRKGGHRLPLGLVLLAVLGLGVAWAHVGAGLAVDGAGRVHFIDTARDILWRVEHDGRLTRVASGIHRDGLRILADGTPEPLPEERGALFSATAPNGVRYRISGHRILRVAAGGAETPFAGDSLPGYADGVGLAARFSRPLRLSSDSAGNLYIADYGNHRIRKITPAGHVTTVALISWPWWPTAVAVWGGTVYVLERWGDYYWMPPVPRFIADLVGHPRVRAVRPDGTSEIVAAVVGRRSRVGAALAVVGLVALISWRLRRAYRRLRHAV